LYGGRGGSKSDFLSVVAADQQSEGKRDVMGDGRRSFVLPPALVVVVLSGCGTPASTVTLAADARADRGGLLVAFSPTASSFDDEQAHVAADANAAQGPQTSEFWHLWIDDQRALLDAGDGQSRPLTVSEGGLSPLGYLEAGPHHFMVGTSEGASIFDGDAQVPSGGTLRLLLFGRLEALEGRFVATPDVPASGNEHVTVVNLLRTGQSLEVVTCTGAAACVPVSPALGLGDLFDTEVPACSDGAAATMTADGVGIGYRAPPSPAMPAPPVLALQRTAGGPTEAAAPPVFVAAPVYMSDQGQLLFGFN